ncbi:MAG: universal stress protein [Legionella sp.]|nr:MAG: universal stress protein [Legionella sp.]
MYKTILFATDLSNEHSHLTQKAADFAKQLHATLYLLHVIELPASVQLAQSLGFAEMANPAKDDAQTVLGLIGEDVGVPPEQQIVEIGSVKDHIFSTAKKFSCDLIVIGSHSFHGLPAFLGSTAQDTVNHAPCDVLTLRV